MKIIIAVLCCLSIGTYAAESTCYGTTSNGYLENGIQLPAEGPNYVGYSNIARLLGRTYVHSEVYNIVLGAYANLENHAPGKVFKYAETGFQSGGQFYPHKTHRNGLSVDFMTPVVNQQGQSVHLSTHPLNKFGYNIEFDHRGHYQTLTIDYEAMGAHLVALHQAAIKQGYDLWRVIFDPDLQPYLFQTQYGNYLKKHIQFSKRRSWVRHDDHYHVDFDIPCQS
ncbi:penicillin-insensitive murein endopeptidase [Photobacterium galatheae]|uniref:Peptidase n=1 Tax=Photobacterium galatheae TaxID=1654360 RepID=A0A066RRA6_9GAMM|nr:penicillin-insensitive murein endopeptidase [Photobacterium galatheae]KDM91641.1 peptidase [Photobacterium galatheae]MCM0149715.1 penicillin-insensitive murein endopeptidase [Photobacterium galatheae]